MKIEELDTIRNWIKNNIIQNGDIMFSDEIRGDDKNPDLIEVIVALYEYLHFEVTGEEYDYFFHWANKIGSWVDTRPELFREDKNE